MMSTGVEGTCGSGGLCLSVKGTITTLPVSHLTSACMPGLDMAKHHSACPAGPPSSSSSWSWHTTHPRNGRISPKQGLSASPHLKHDARRLRRCAYDRAGNTNSTRHGLREIQIATRSGKVEISRCRSTSTHAVTGFRCSSLSEIPPSFAVPDLSLLPTMRCEAMMPSPGTPSRGAPAPV
jgi:hypothetical protein